MWTHHILFIHYQLMDTGWTWPHKAVWVLGHGPGSSAATLSTLSAVMANVPSTIVWDLIPSVLPSLWGGHYGSC